MEKKIAKLLIWLALAFIIVEGIASIIYHAPSDPNWLSITNVGRYTRVLAALVAALILKGVE
jgi:cytochrome c biogenesis factor